MKDDANDLLTMSVGAGGAIFLGMALTPLRGLTPAANFTFVFMAFTILVAELGGRGAAVATALTSALSLDFFLTEPYLRLTIASKHDLIAFLGLASCGLIAAFFHGRREELAVRSRHLALVDNILARVEKGEAFGPADKGVFESVLAALPLAGLVLRDSQGGLVMAAGGAEARLAPTGGFEADRPGPLPTEGSRLGLVAGGRTVGSLDVWGNGREAGSAERSILTILARVLAARLTARPAPTA